MTQSACAAQPLVSVIIPTRNRAPLLRAAIESVFAVDRRCFNIELIVVDDGSTDETGHLLSNYALIHLRTKGLGVAAARNAGIQASHGAFITFLDDDDLWLADNVKPQLELLIQQPELGGAYAQYRLTGPDRKPIMEPHPPSPVRSGWIFNDLLTSWPQLGSVVLRRTVIQEVGGQDPALSAGEDWDWLLRIARRYPIGGVDKAVLLFQRRDDPEEELSWFRLRSMLYIFRRHSRYYRPYRWWSVQQIIWRHRGWWAAEFLREALLHIRSGKRTRALHCIWYGLRASPVHMLLGAWRLFTRLS